MVCVSQLPSAKSEPGLRRLMIHFLPFWVETPFRKLLKTIKLGTNKQLPSCNCSKSLALAWVLACRPGYWPILTSYCLLGQI